MAASLRLSFLGVALVLSAAYGFCQLPSSHCDGVSATLADCGFLAQSVSAQNASETGPTTANSSGIPSLQPHTPQAQAATRADNSFNADAIAPGATAPAKEGFHWGPALRESFTFLAIEQAYVVKDDFRWVVIENGIPFNHYWRDYKQSLSAWIHSGWSDGDPNMYGYVGHPIQGALTSYIEIQNDPAGRDLEFANTKEYWKSRLKATLWNAVYSTQWNLGPISEVTVEKYGAKARPPWNQDGSWPCTRKPCLTGVGQIDIVMTPVGGFGWMLAEDWLDKKLVRRVEDVTSNRFLIDTLRAGLNPTRSGASILHGQAPWYRPRDRGPTNLLAQNQNPTSLRGTPQASSAASASSHVPDRGNVFAGYSYTNSDVVTGYHSGLSGWNLAVEKKILPFFGLVGDISGQYGSPRVPADIICRSAGNLPGACIITNTGVHQYTFLTGIRGGHWAWRFRPFAQALVGAVRNRETTAGVSSSNTGFAADLGLGVDLQLVPRVGWRMQADYVTTGTFVASQHNVRLSIGPAIRF